MNNHALTQARPVMQFGELLKADSEKDAVSIAGDRKSTRLNSSHA